MAGRYDLRIPWLQFRVALNGGRRRVVRRHVLLRERLQRRPKKKAVVCIRVILYQQPQTMWLASILNCHSSEAQSKRPKQPQTEFVELKIQ